MAPNRADQVIEELYPRVMSGVIEASLVDFEDSGISQSILKELKSLWEQNLTKTRVGHFPWDLAPPVSPIIKQEPDDSPTLAPLHSAFQKSRPTPPTLELTPLQCHNTAHLETIPGRNGGPQGAQGSGARNILGASLQQELRPTNTTADHPGTGITPLQRYQMQLGEPSHNLEVARQRAQQYVLQQQQQLARPGMTAAQAVLGRFTAVSSLSAPPNIYQQQQQPMTQNPLGNQFGEQPAPENDGAGQCPMNQSYPEYRPSTSYPYPSNSYPYPATSYPYSDSLQPPSPTLPQLDGPSDASPSGTPLPTPVVIPPARATAGGVASEDPNDADDSSSADEEEDPEEIPELLVCLYDKVAKARNKSTHKWRCVLRDGVLVVGEKEYAFGKASAELMW